MEMGYDRFVNLVMQEYKCNKRTAELVISSARLNGEEQELRKDVEQSYKSEQMKG